MALKIIGAGFGRTGTLSILHALNQLGFPCYHMSEVVLNKANKSHLNFWRKVANSPPGAQQPSIDKVPLRMVFGAEVYVKCSEYSFEYITPCSRHGCHNYLHTLVYAVKFHTATVINEYC